MIAKLTQRIYITLKCIMSYCCYGWFKCYLVYCRQIYCWHVYPFTGLFSWNCCYLRTNFFFCFCLFLSKYHFVCMNNCNQLWTSVLTKGKNTIRNVIAGYTRAAPSCIACYRFLSLDTMGLRPHKSLALNPDGVFPYS